MHAAKAVHAAPGALPLRWHEQRAWRSADEKQRHKHFQRHPDLLSVSFLFFFKLLAYELACFCRDDHERLQGMSSG